MAKKKNKNKKVKVKRGKTVSLKNTPVKKKISTGKFKNTSTRTGTASFNSSDNANKRIGSFGGIVFRVVAHTYSDGSRLKKVLTPSDIKQEVSGEWQEHKVIGKKPKTEFTGPGLRTLQYQIVIDVQLGYKPHKILKKLNKFVENGKVDIFTLGNHKIGTGKWKMEKVSESFNLVYSGGELARATVDVTLSEYF